MVLDAKPNGSWGDKDTIPFEILIGGNFAAALDTSDRAKFDDVADQVYASTIVATSWYLEQVFIVKAAKTIASHDPCTAKLDFLSDARICIDDVAYIFVKTGDISKLYPDNDYPKVQGIDKLKDYGLDAKAMIRAAEWFDKEFGLKKPSNSDLKDYMTGNKKGPPGNLWVSLPVIDYEKTPSISRNAWKIYGSSWSNPWVRDDSSPYHYLLTVFAGAPPQQLPAVHQGQERLALQEHGPILRKMHFRYLGHFVNQCGFGYQ
jgi:hypothetical protein